MGSTRSGTDPFSSRLTWDMLLIKIVDWFSEFSKKHCVRERTINMRRRIGSCKSNGWTSFHVVIYANIFLLERFNSEGYYNYLQNVSIASLDEIGLLSMLISHDISNVQSP